MDVFIQPPRWRWCVRAQGYRMEVKGYFCRRVQRLRAARRVLVGFDTPQAYPVRSLSKGQPDRRSAASSGFSQGPVSVLAQAPYPSVPRLHSRPHFRSASPIFRSCPTPFPFWQGSISVLARLRFRSCPGPISVRTEVSKCPTRSTRLSPRSRSAPRARPPSAHTRPGIADSPSHPDSPPCPSLDPGTPS